MTFNSSISKDDNGNEGVGQALFRYMYKWGDNIGQIIEATGEEDTFGEMRCRSIRTGIKLQSMGFGSGHMISTCSENHKNSCIPEIASFFIGAIPSYFDPNLPELDTISLLKLIQPKIIFVSLEALKFMERCLSKAGIYTKIVVFGNHEKYDSFDEFLVPSPAEACFAPVKIKNNRETAVIMFSSGTTGKPKGICLSHYTLLCPNLYKGIDQCLSGSKSTYLLYTTLYWISGLSYLIKSILVGAKKIVCTKFDPSSFWYILQKYKVELTFITPYQGSDCFKCKPPKIDTSSLKVITTGSCLVPTKFMEDLHQEFHNAKVLNVYAMTEVGAIISKFDPTKQEDMKMQREKPQSVGRIVDLFKWKVVDCETGKALGPHQKGELLLKSEIVMNGYYKMDSSFVFDEEGYLRTGDLVYYDEDNCLFMEERVREMFKYRGWHIMPSVLEEVILRHPAIKQTVVVGIPHEEDGHRPMALVIFKDNCSGVSTEEILEYVNNNVSDAQKLRAGLKIINGDLPRTATGKLKRQVIREMVSNGSL